MSRITINMDDDDFQGLYDNAMRWGFDWRRHDGRFENVTKGKKYSDPPSYEWAMAYWIGDNKAEKLIACAYLDSIGESYEVLWDLYVNGSDVAGYVIVTNYLSEGWKENA